MPRPRSAWRNCSTGPAWTPRVETDAPATVGVNLNLGTDNAGPLLTLDLNNCDLAVETDTLRPAPAITTTIHLPDEWRGRELQASYVTPEMKDGAQPVPLAADAAIVDPQRGTLRLRTPAFDTCLIVFLRSHRLSSTTPWPWNLARARDDFAPPQKAETMGEP